MSCAALVRCDPDFGSTAMTDSMVFSGQTGAFAHRNRRIGLLGGSFNPAHNGHRYISLEAIKRLGLDEVWWLVSPQNPLKSESGMASFARRLSHARAVAQHPRIHVSTLEAEMGTRYTAGHPANAGATLSGGTIRVVDGGRQSGPDSALAGLVKNISHGPHCRLRPRFL